MDNLFDDDGNGGMSGTAGAGLDLRELADKLQEVQAMLHAVSEMLPKDAAGEKHAEIDEGTAEAQDKATEPDTVKNGEYDDGDKEDRKSAAISILSRQM